MAIIGLTDRGASFPQIGVLRKGGEKKDERKPGPDLKHFRFDTDDEDALSAFHSIYGDEPRAVRVFVPFATVAENFEAWREEWTAGSLKHRCDGQTCVRWLNGSAYSDKPKPCPGGCKPTGRLKVIIPELKRLAYVTVLTTSIHDIMTIQANLMALEAARNDLRGIPMLLRRSPREISTPGNGNRVRREKWLITIEAQPSWVELQLTAQQRAALPAGNAPLALMAAPTGDDEDDDFIDAEYSKPAPLHVVASLAHPVIEAEPLIAPQSVTAIVKLWPDYGPRFDNGSVKPLIPYLKAKYDVSEVASLTAEMGGKLLGWLQSRAVAAEQAQTELLRGKPSAADPLEAARTRLFNTGITEDQYLAELRASNFDNPGLY